MTQDEQTAFDSLQSAHDELSGFAASFPVLQQKLDDLYTEFAKYKTDAQAVIDKLAADYESEISTLTDSAIAQINALKDAHDQKLSGIASAAATPDASGTNTAPADGSSAG